VQVHQARDERVPLQAHGAAGRETLRPRPREHATIRPASIATAWSASTARGDRHHVRGGISVSIDCMRWNKKPRRRVFCGPWSY
jgi:hypothetical protein